MKIHYTKPGTPLSQFCVWRHREVLMRWRSEKQVDRERNSFLGLLSTSRGTRYRQNFILLAWLLPVRTETV